MKINDFDRPKPQSLQREKQNRFCFSLRVLLALVAGSSAVLAIPYWIPRSEELSETRVGYYRGLGITEGSGYFGKNWYRIVVNNSDGYLEVDVDELGYVPYRGLL